MPDPFVPVDHAIVGIVDAVRSLTGDDPARPEQPTPSPTGPPADAVAAVPKRRARKARP
jgi:hypothetical protein